MPSSFEFKISEEMDSKELATLFSGEDGGIHFAAFFLGVRGVGGGSVQLKTETNKL
jgi:hypothetical protein